MDEECAREYLSILLDYAYDLLHVHQLGVNHAEFIFCRVWQVLNSHTTLKVWFMGLVENTVLGPEISLADMKKRPEWFVDEDLVAFISHMSRWEEFREIAERRKAFLREKGGCIGSRDISDSILESLSDDWEDSEFYETIG